MERTNDGAIQERIPGGFRRIPVAQLLDAWHAYRTERQITFFDWRVYLALHEIEERRRAARAGRRLARRRVRTPARTQIVNECMKLAQVRDARLIRAALRRLIACNLVTSTNEGVVLGASNVSRAVELPPSRSRHASVRTRRTVPIPRRVLRHLARQSSVVETATVLGLLVRCLFHHSGHGWRCEGSCSASFVASTFAVHSRSVKRVRRRLMESGWLMRLSADHWHVQSHGGRMRVCLGAPCGSRGEEGAGCSSPRRRPEAHRLSPPESKQYPLAGYRNQPCASRPGFFVKGQGAVRPSLRNVLPHDLRNPRRMAELHREAMARGWVSGSECDRLRVFAAAAHALRVGHKPCALFIATLQRGLWAFISQVDEDHARDHLRGVAEVGPSDGVPPSRTEAVGGGSAMSSELKRIVSELAESRTMPWGHANGRLWTRESISGRSFGLRRVAAADCRRVAL